MNEYFTGLLNLENIAIFIVSFFLGASWLPIMLFLANLVEGRRYRQQQERRPREK